MENWIGDLIVIIVKHCPVCFGDELLFIQYINITMLFLDIVDVFLRVKLGSALRASRRWPPVVGFLTLGRCLVRESIYLLRVQYFEAITIIFKNFMAIAAILYVLSRIENFIISPVIIIIVPRCWLVLVIIIWIFVETYELTIVILGKTVECNRANLLVRMEYRGLGWLLVVSSAS